MSIRETSAALALFAATLCASTGAGADPTPLDPRFTMEPRINRNLAERPIVERYRWPPGIGRPLRCSIRREIAADYLPGYSNWTLEEPVAPLREYEFGFERVGDPATSDRIEAFMRFRFERLSDGKPLRVERALANFEGGWGTTSGWNPTPLDAEGFSGARIGIDDMEVIELPFFFNWISERVRFAVTLPELGQDRVYWIGKGPHKVNTELLAECMCGFGNDEVSWVLREYCAMK
jgi:hypothetical protein